MGATSGESFTPRKIREFDVSSLHEIEQLNADRPKPSTSEAPCPRWLVTIAANPASPNLKALAKILGWCKVFVLDKNSPPDFALEGPGVVVLTEAGQEALPWRMARLLSWNHFGRKNLGYAYAVLHGAEVIYDTDEDHVIQSSSSGELLLPSSLSHRGDTHLAPSTADGAYNPYPFWGAGNAWPRGFPLSLLNTFTARAGATLASARPPGHRTCVLQSLINTELDTDATDAIYRQTHTQPPVFSILNATLGYPAGVFAPANAQATLLSRDVAAALLLPVTVDGRVSDIWRSYIMQRVMWDSGCRLAFADPWVKQYRSAHGYLNDIQPELDLFLKAEGVLKVLTDIDFGQESALGPRVFTAFKQLYENGLIEELDVKLAYAYLRDLSLLDSVTQFGGGAPTGPGAMAVVPASEPSSSANRALVCITGKFRAGPFTLPLFKKNVYEPLGMPFDTVVSMPPASVEEEEEDATDFLYLLPNLAAVVHPDYSNYSWMEDLDWNNTVLVPDTWSSPAKMIGQLADLHGCNEGIRRIGAKYTHALRIRADTLIMDPLPKPLTEIQLNKVVVPDNEEYRGVNDRYVYGRIEDMTILFDELLSVPELLKKAPVREGLRGWKWTAEEMYLAYAIDKNVGFDKLPVRLCRARNFTGGVLELDEHDVSTFPVCREYAGRFLRS